jgi:hypothetical protein
VLQKLLILLVKYVHVPLAGSAPPLKTPNLPLAPPRNILLLKKVRALIAFVDQSADIFAVR